MRRMLPLCLVAVALAACGGSSPTGGSLRVEFGTTGGNILPQKFTLTVNGDLASSLQKAFAPGGVTSRSCSGTLPDAAADYIRVGGRTVTVRGGCEPSFTRLWQKLYALRGAG